MAKQITSEFRAVFIHIPKTGGTSVETSRLFRQTISGKAPYGHATANRMQKSYPREFADYFKFTVVRNPYTRLISAYNYLAKGGGNAYDREMFEQHMQLPENEINQFCQQKLSSSIGRVIHLRPQYQYLYSPLGKLLIEHIYAQENLDESLTRMFPEQFDLEWEQKQLRKGASVDYRNLLDPASIELIQSVYAADFTCLGYDTDPARMLEPPDLNAIKQRLSWREARQHLKFILSKRLQKWFR